MTESVQQENERLRKALTYARNRLVEWQRYIPAQYQIKYNIDGDIAQITAEIEQ